MTGRIAAIATCSLAVAVAGIIVGLANAAGHDHTISLTDRIMATPTVISALHGKVPAKDAFSGRITGVSGQVRGDHGHATADLGVSASRAAKRRLTVTLHGNLCNKSNHCVRISGQLKGRIIALADRIPDAGRSFTIRATGFIRRLGRVSVRGRVHGTGFVYRGRESLHLTATAKAGRLAFRAHTRPVPAFTSP